MKKKFLMVVTVLFCILLAGCGKEDIFSNRSTELQKMELDYSLISRNPGAPFAISDEGDFFLVEDGRITQYSSEGEMLCAFEDTESASTLCLIGENLYFYTYEDSLKCVSLENGKTKTISEKLFLTEMKNLVAAEGFLFAEAYSEDNGGEETILIKIDSTNGRTEVIDLEGKLCSIYGSTEGKLYYLADTAQGNMLYHYSDQDEESELICNITDRIQMDPPTGSFIYEQNEIAYVTVSDSLVFFSLEKGKVSMLPILGSLYYGKDMAYAKGNLVIQSFDRESMTAKRKQFFLGDVRLETPEDALRDTVTLCAMVDKQLNDNWVESTAGIRSKYIVTDLYSDEFLIDVMAGNPEIDIFVLDVGAHTSQAMKEKEYYEPLNSSEIIKRYQESCFSYLQTEMETDCGDIWMLPIGIDANVLWYVEDNLNLFQVKMEQLALRDSFCELSGELKDKLKQTEYRAYVIPQNISLDWIRQYESLYCDFPHKKVNYKTEVFCDFFESNFKGWTVYGDGLSHPYFDNRYNEKAIDPKASVSPRYDSNCVLYKYDSVSNHLTYGDVEGWRVAPCPRLNDEIKGNSVTIRGLVINPYSRKKELAIKYLEEVAKKPLGICKGGYYARTSFLYEDKEFYGDFYDFSQSAVQDLYNLFRDGRVVYGGYQDVFQIIDDYQNDRLSLDEAINKLERDTEIYLNE